MSDFMSEVYHTVEDLNIYQSNSGQITWMRKEPTMYSGKSLGSMPAGEELKRGNGKDSRRLLDQSKSGTSEWRLFERFETKEDTSVYVGLESVDKAIDRTTLVHSHWDS